MAEEERIRAGAWRQEELHRIGAEERLRRVVRSAMVTEPLFSPRAQEQDEEAFMMARWAEMVQSTVDGTERALSAATGMASDSGRQMREREAAAEREKELAHEYLVREVETTKALAAKECEKAFTGRVQTTAEEQNQADELSARRSEFETAFLQREAKHREGQAGRRDAEERWRLRRKEREEIVAAEERIERAQKEEAASIAKVARSADLHRAITAMDKAQREREEALARREAEHDEQRRYRERRECELEAARREEAELADNMISNLDRKYREQEETAVAVRMAEASYVDRSKLENESRTRAPFQAYRAAEHLQVAEEVENYAEQQEERDAYSLSLTEGDMERRGRAAYRLHRELNTPMNGDDRTLKSKSYHYGTDQTGGPTPSGTDHETRAKLGSMHVDEYNADNEKTFQSNQLQGEYWESAQTFEDAAGQTRPRPSMAHIHNEEEYDYAASAVSASGNAPAVERPLRKRLVAEGRLFAGVQTPRQEMEEAREAKHTLKREEERSSLEAARARREAAEYMYSARTVHLAQLKARYEQYLAEASPALAAAQAAAGSINPDELASIFADPQAAPVVQAVCVAACILLTGNLDLTYEQARDIMSPPSAFVASLRDSQTENAGQSQVAAVQQLMRTLDVDEVLGASASAAALMMWAANVARYNQTYSNVGPVRMEMAEATQLLEKADVERREAAKYVSYCLTWKQ